MRSAEYNSLEITSELIGHLKRKLHIESIDILKKWIDHQNNNGTTALHLASKKGNLEIIKLLIEHKANIEVLDLTGKSVIHYAAQGNKPGPLVYFKETHLMNIHSIDDKGSTILHMACYSLGQENATDFILSWNIEVNKQDREGKTALHLAVDSGK